MIKIIGVILILIIGWFVAGMVRPILSQITNVAITQTPAGSLFTIALLGTFVTLPLIWVFIRAYNWLKGSDTGDD